MRKSAYNPCVSRFSSAWEPVELSSTSLRYISFKSSPWGADIFRANVKPYKEACLIPSQSQGLILNDFTANGKSGTSSQKGQNS